MSEVTPPTVYPMPSAQGDPRFTRQLLLDIKNMIEAYGYPPIQPGPDLLELHLALYRFLYGPRPVEGGAQ